MNEWFNEKVESVPKNNGLYRLICFLSFKRRLSYKELYLFILGLNRDRKEFKDKEELVKKIALEKVLETYKYNNGVLPEYRNKNDIG